MNREVLERPFEADKIKTRPGAHGDMLSYVEGADYIRRLNEAFDGAWSFTIEDHHLMTNHVVVIGKITAGAIKKMAFGGSAITFRKNSKEPAASADDGRPHLNCVALDLGKLVATDGHRLHMAPLPARLPETILLPLESAKTLDRLLKQADQVIMARAGEVLRIRIGQWHLGVLTETPATTSGA